MKTPKNKIIIQTDHKWCDTKVLEGGHVIHIATEYHPEEHASIEGTVVAVAEVVGNDLFRRHIANIVRPGDKIYFHYNQFLDEDNLFIHNGMEYWMLDYMSAFCVERDGELIAIGDYVLVEPPKPEARKSGLIVFAEGFDELPKQQGTLALIGSLPENYPALECQAGDTVWFQKDCEFENTIAGKKYWVMRQDNLMGYARRGD